MTKIKNKTQNMTKIKSDKNKNVTKLKKKLKI